MLDDEQVEATVLVVDDEINIVTLLQTWLETIGCKVESASDGESGVQKAKEICPDLILMDGMMPKLSGFDACRLLKAEESTRDIPVIFLTVQNEVKDVVKGLELGAHGYMTKPFKPQELLARVRSTLKIKQIQDRLKVHTAKLRQQWNWMHGVVESLPLGLVVLDPQSRDIVYVNERMSKYLAADGQNVATKEVEFSKDEKPISPWELDREFDDVLSISWRGESKGAFRVRASHFEKNGRTGLHLLMEPA
jgi:DNA-binding response OmpR family regulator